jgi:hypothetical protein
MWPFKKNKKPPTLKVAKSILCIPGPWNDFEDFQKSLILNTGAAYMVVGNILIAGERQRHYTFEFCERDENMKESFTCAGKVTGVTEEFLDGLLALAHNLRKKAA